MFHRCEPVIFFLVFLVWLVPGCPSKSADEAPDASLSGGRKGLVERVAHCGAEKRILLPEKRASLAASYGAEVTTLETFQEVTGALDREDEEDVVRRLESKRIGLLLLDRDADPKPGPGPLGSVRFRIHTNGKLDRLSPVSLDSQTVVLAKTHPAFAPDEARDRKAMAYVRDRLVGKNGSLPDEFSKPHLDGKAHAALRASDGRGALEDIGRVEGVGRSPKEAIDAAAQAFMKKWSESGKESLVEILPRLTLTLHQDRESTHLEDARVQTLREQISLGLDGIELRTNEGRTLRIPPEFVKIHKKEVKRPKKRTKWVSLKSTTELLGEICKIHSMPIDCWKKAEIRKFRTVDLTERSPGGQVIRLWRGWEWIEPKRMDRAEVLNSFTAGAQWLLRAFNGETGMFTYSYHAVDNKTVKNKYNMIRHLLATMTLLQAYEITKEKSYLEAGEKAIDFVLQRLEYEKLPSGRDMAYFHHKKYDSKYKLGGVGCLLQAMAIYHGLSPKPDWKRPMQALAEHIMHMRKPEGPYRSIYTKPGQEPSRKEILIYPGEANLGLLLLHRHYPDKRYLEHLQLVIDYHYEWFKKFSNPRHKGTFAAYVPWETAAMSELAMQTGDDRAAEFAFAMADWLNDNWFAYGPEQTWFPDYVGGIKKSHSKYDFPLWNTGVFGEGTVAAWRLAVHRKDVKRSEKYRKIVHLSMRFIRQLQYQSGGVWYLPNFKKALGAIPGDFFDDECRLDYVYHCMTVHYNALKHFSDEDFGALGVGN